MSTSERRSYYAARYDDTMVSAHTALLKLAFERDLAKGSIRPLLTHIKLFGVVTTYGSPWWITRVIAGDPGRKVVMRALKPMCGRRVHSFFLAQYDLDRSTPAARAAFIARVNARIARI
jgi:hypothetical protein